MILAKLMPQFYESHRMRKKAEPVCRDKNRIVYLLESNPCYSQSILDLTQNRWNRSTLASVIL